MQICVNKETEIQSNKSYKVNCYCERSSVETVLFVWKHRTVNCKTVVCESAYALKLSAMWFPQHRINRTNSCVNSNILKQILEKNKNFEARTPATDTQSFRLWHRNVKAVRSLPKCKQSNLIEHLLYCEPV